MNHCGARPKQRKGWNDAVRQARGNLKKLVTDARSSQVRPIPALPENAIPPLWRDEKKIAFTSKKLTVKDLFSQAQHGLCGYCGAKVIATATGSLDHYRPARAIHREIKASGGEIAPHVSRKRDSERLPNPPHRPGWWNLAYSWKNYVFSCKLCNESWKIDLFMATLRGKPYLGPRNRSELPLLLNPFDDDPTPHLDFTELGMIQGLTERGTATIDTCGLDRPSLVVDRKDEARIALDFCADLTAPGRSQAETKKRLQRLVERGSWNHRHALVTRKIAERELGMSWSDIETQLQNIA